MKLFEADLDEITQHLTKKDNKKECSLDKYLKRE
jgi:hypothetical protein